MIGPIKLKFTLHGEDLKNAVREGMGARGKRAGGMARGSSALARAAALVEKEAKLSMKTGGRSTGPLGGKVRTPSKPGTPPNVQTGNLRASIRVAPTDKGTFLVGPTTTAWYGRLHEQVNKSVSPGTVTEFGGKRFPQRAFMRPALFKVYKEFPRLFRNLPLANTPTGRRMNARKGRP